MMAIACNKKQYLAWKLIFNAQESALCIFGIKIRCIKHLVHDKTKRLAHLASYQKVVLEWWAKVLRMENAIKKQNRPTLDKAADMKWCEVVGPKNKTKWETTLK